MLHHESDLNSLVLPMFGPLPEGASDTIRGIDNPFEKHIGEVAVKKYISKLVEDRDVAMATGQSYRNRMENHVKCIVVYNRLEHFGTMKLLKVAHVLSRKY